MSRINEIRAREQAATPGPWNYGNGTLDFKDKCYIRSGVELIVGLDGGLRENNAAFIAHAREDIPFLLSEHNRLTARVEQLEAELAGYRKARKPGDEVWCIERDDNEVELSGYIFVAQNDECVIVSAEPYGHNDTISQYLIAETQEDYGANVYVFPLDDVYDDREEAAAALQRDK